jgi:hypothetical protein
MSSNRGFYIKDRSKTYEITDPVEVGDKGKAGGYADAVVLRVALGEVLELELEMPTASPNMPPVMAQFSNVIIHGTIKAISIKFFRLLSTELGFR